MVEFQKYDLLMAPFDGGAKVLICTLSGSVSEKDLENYRGFVHVPSVVWNRGVGLNNTEYNFAVFPHRIGNLKEIFSEADLAQILGF